MLAEGVEVAAAVWSPRCGRRGVAAVTLQHSTAAATSWAAEHAAGAQRAAGLHGRAPRQGARRVKVKVRLVGLLVFLPHPAREDHPARGQAVPRALLPGAPARPCGSSDSPPLQLVSSR